jgi:hypothetical protein
LTAQTGDRVRWVRSWPHEERPRFRVGRSGSDLVADWPGVATLITDRSGARCDYRVVERALPPDLAAKLYAGQVRGLLRHLDGELTFHASAVALDQVGVLFIGGSGAGKSSLAAALCTRHGAEFFSDDAAGVLLDPPRLQRLETDHWLLPEAATALGLGSPLGRDKRPWAPTRMAQHPARLAAIVLLGFTEWGRGARRLEPLRGTAVFQALNAAAFRFIVDEPAVARRDLDQIAALAAQVPSFRLDRSPSPAGLLQDSTLIRDLLSSPGCARPEGDP